LAAHWLYPVSEPGRTKNLRATCSAVTTPWRAIQRSICISLGSSRGARTHGPCSRSMGRAESESSESSSRRDDGAVTVPLRWRLGGRSEGGSEVTPAYAGGGLNL